MISKFIRIYDFGDMSGNTTANKAVKMDESEVEHSLVEVVHLTSVTVYIPVFRGKNFREDEVEILLED